MEKNEIRVCESFTAVIKNSVSVDALQKSGLFAGDLVGVYPYSVNLFCQHISKPSTIAVRKVNDEKAQMEMIGIFNLDLSNGQLCIISEAHQELSDSSYRSCLATYIGYNCEDEEQYGLMSGEKIEFFPFSITMELDNEDGLSISPVVFISICKLKNGNPIKPITNVPLYSLKFSDKQEKMVLNLIFKAVDKFIIKENLSIDQRRHLVSCLKKEIILNSIYEQSLEKSFTDED